MSDGPYERSGMSDRPVSDRLMSDRPYTVLRKADLMLLSLVRGCGSFHG